MKDFQKNFQRSRTLGICPGAPLLAALALGLAVTLGGPAVHAGGADTSVTHLPPILTPQPMHLIWGSVRERGETAGVDAVQASDQNTAPSQAAPAPTETHPYHVFWVRVRLYEDGGYDFLPNNADEDNASGEGMDDDSMVAFVPLVVKD